MRLEKDKALLVVIDVQGNLALSMHAKEELFENLEKLVKGVKALGVPVLWLEQMPEKLGLTLPSLSKLLEGQEPVTKSCFDSTCSDAFMQRLKSLGKSQLVICGIEAHVCVLQTALGLKSRGFEVFAVADAVSSRTKTNKKFALKRLEEEGVFLTTVEMSLFEMVGDASVPAFKEVLKIIK